MKLRGFCSVSNGLSVPVVFAAGFIFTGCEQDAPPPAPPPPAEVTVIKVEPIDTPLVSEFVGKTESSRRVEIRARVEGFLDKRLYTEGEMVEEGEVLFQMDQKPFQAELDAANAELAQHTAIMNTAKAHLDRLRPLVEQNAVAQKELDDALGQYQSAVASVEAANAKIIQAELNLGYTTIKSPVSGISSFAVQQEGAYIGYGTDSVLTYVAQLHPIWVEFSVSENQLLRARAAEQAGTLRSPEDENYEVEIVLADGTVYPERGRITFADASLSDETGTFLIRAEIANPEELLRPGQFVRVRIRGAYRPNAIMLPQRAVQQGAKGSFVWVINDQREAEFRPIEVGAWRGEDWFVEEGLRVGEKVVVDGALQMQAGAKVTIGDIVDLEDVLSTSSDAESHAATDAEPGSDPDAGDDDVDREPTESEGDPENETETNRN